MLLNRLTKEIVDTSAAGVDFTNEYVLDLVGNRTEKIENEGRSIAGHNNVYSYNARDQLLSEADGSIDNQLWLRQQWFFDIAKRRWFIAVLRSWDVRGRLNGATRRWGIVTKV